MSQDKLKGVFERCWKDETFKKRFVSEPDKVLDEEGFEVPEGIKVKVIENAPGEMNIVLPINPESPELSDDDLDQVAGGGIQIHRFKRKFIVKYTSTQGKECIPW
jgi:hypothetical protein